MNSGISNAGSAPTKPITYLLYVLGAAIPLIIALYWPVYWLHPAKTAVLLRPAVLLVSLVLAFLCGSMPVSRMEKQLAGLLGLFCLISFGVAFGATDVQRALEGCLKVVLLCIMALLLSRALRNPIVIRGLGRSMLASSIIISAFIVFTYVRIMGWNVPTFDVARQFKALALVEGIPLNAVPFTAVMAYVTGMCILRWNLFTWLTGAAVLYICSAFTGSRTPLAVFLLSGFLLLLANAIHRRSLLLRFQALVAGLAILAGIVLGLETLSFNDLSKLTEGRWDLWYVAVQKFSERPLIGYGFASVDDDLFVRAPGVYKMPSKRDGKFPGGYHNEFLGTLAEEGLLGFIPVAAIYWFLLRSCWQLAFRKWQTWHNGQWALVGGLFLFFRAGVELPGLFGYANGPPDFLAYLFLALVVSRFSAEEDCATAVVMHQSRRNSQVSLRLQPVLGKATLATQEI